jgi:hypothetical protein
MGTIYANNMSDNKGVVAKLSCDADKHPGTHKGHHKTQKIGKLGAPTNTHIVTAPSQ